MWRSESVSCYPRDSPWGRLITVRFLEPDGKKSAVFRGYLTLIGWKIRFEKKTVYLWQICGKECLLTCRGANRFMLFQAAEPWCDRWLVVFLQQSSRVKLSWPCWKGNNAWSCEGWIWVFPKIGVFPKHPKMIIFSRKTHGCWVPPFLETYAKWIYYASGRCPFVLWRTIVFLTKIVSSRKVYKSCINIYIYAVYSICSIQYTFCAICQVIPSSMTL